MAKGAEGRGMFSGGLDFFVAIRSACIFKRSGMVSSSQDFKSS